jgi:hypothetical protein
MKKVIEIFICIWTRYISSWEEANLAESTLYKVVMKIYIRTVALFRSTLKPHIDM